jgi:hypothetical protein
MNVNDPASRDKPQGVGAITASSLARCKESKRLFRYDGAKVSAALLSPER